jgi:hypothetical protein
VVIHLIARMMQADAGVKICISQNKRCSFLKKITRIVCAPNAWKNLKRNNRFLSTDLADSLNPPESAGAKVAKDRRDDAKKVFALLCELLCDLCV